MPALKRRDLSRGALLLKAGSPELGRPTSTPTEERRNGPPLGQRISAARDRSFEPCSFLPRHPRRNAALNFVLDICISYDTLSIMNDTENVMPHAFLAGAAPLGQGAPVMLTGDQIAGARRTAGFRSQEKLAEVAGVSRPTIARAEGAKTQIPEMDTGAMSRIVRALEAAGIEFYLERGASAAGGLGFRLKKPGA